MSQSVEEQLFNACNVFCLDPRIVAWLEEHDPMALKQAREAIQQYNVKHEFGNDLSCYDDEADAPENP